MTYSFQTLEKAIEEVDFKEKGSKFIGYAYPVDSEDEAKAEIERLWELHPDATHICYAYRLGMEGELYRANDDGEPSGTAGLPIYNQILSKGVTNVVVASVRYYGGTKLGVGGLIKAYKLSAQMTLEEGKVVEKHLKERVHFVFSYEDQGPVMRNADQFEAEVLNIDFTDKIEMTVKIKKERLEAFLASYEPLYQVEIKVLEEG